MSVRDETSKQTLQDIGVSSQLIADPVFTYHPKKISAVKNTKKRIGIAFRQGYLKNETETLELLLELLLDKNYEPVLLPHSFHPSDSRSNDFLFLEPFAQKYNLEIAENMLNVLATYQTVDFVIGMRLHSIILSVVHHVPFIAVSYSKKTDSVLFMLKWAHILDAKETDAKAIMNELQAIQNNKDALLLDLEKKLAILRKNITKALRNLWTLQN